jgi:TonB family protein
MIIATLLASLAAAQAPGPAVRASADLVSSFRAADYPAAAMLAGEEGRVGVSVSVGRDGRVTGCRVTRSSGSHALDEGTCAILRERTRYTPARNGAGEATADEVAELITWALPAEPLGARARADLASYVHPEDYPPDAQILGQSGRVEFEVDVSPEGRAVNCRVMRSQAGEQLNLRTCHIMLIRARFEPARDARGRAVPDTIQSSINWVIPAGSR